VRAYENRTDLLRTLIIGPENTPYEDAPFVIDWMLDSNFPYSPPIAHFLSWTNGNGRGEATFLSLLYLRLILSQSQSVSK
jgi:ubiquitin-conjugating enzyme E2 O